jgi:PEP-CTERM motif
LTSILNRNLSRGFAAGALAIALSAASAAPAFATKFELTLSVVFNGTGADPATNPTETLTPTGGGANLLTTANEAFTLTGIFDTSTGTLLPPFPFPSKGFVAYAPSSVTLTVGGTTYSVATYDGSMPDGGLGVSVAIFDTTQVFGTGHYGAGFIQTPVPDGAGIVGDWLTATPMYTATSLAPTTYSDYFGVGFGSGICSMPGSGVDCATTPIPLDGGLYELTLGTYDLNNPANGIPTDPTIHPPAFQNDHLFSASLTAVPEPSTWALLLAGFVGLACMGFYGRRKAPLSA